MHYKQYSNIFRRWSADKAPKKSKRAVSVLDYKWSNKSAAEVDFESKPRAPVAKSSNYVTVEVICQDDDAKSANRSETSSDYVYIELESPRPKAIQQQESEVIFIFNRNDSLN